MTSGQAPCGGNSDQAVSAIRQRLTREGARLSPAEAVLILEWALTCEDQTKRLELLDLFREAGGLDLLKSVVTTSH